MKKWIAIAAGVGFLSGALWYVPFFVFFASEPQGLAKGLYLLLMLVTCPAWFLGFVGPFIPFLNAGIYALAACIVYMFRETRQFIEEGAAVS